jgi:hypothetical protein
MNQKLQKIFLTIALFCSPALFTIASDCQNCPTGCTKSQNLFQQRAFSSNSERQLESIKTNWSSDLDRDTWCGVFAIGFGYQANKASTCKNSNDLSTSCCTNIGSVPFWSSTTTNNATTYTYSNQMTLGNNSSGSALDVYQMGMGPVTTNGTVTIDPILVQTGADLTLYVESDRCKRGFFIKAHAPIGVATMNPKLTYSDTITSVAYPAGALSVFTGGSAVTAPYDNIAEAFKGGQGAGFLQPMKYGTINGKQSTGAQFGDIEITVGYNVIDDEKKHFGLGVMVTAPSGNKATAVRILEPIFGNNGHWGAGVELIGHWQCYEQDDKKIDVWLEGNVQHLFNAQYIRSFDLALNGAGSKYLLLAKYTGAGVFQNEIINAINVTTLGVKSTFGVVGDFTLAADFHWKNWSLMLGYNGWGRSCENLTLNCDCTLSTLNNYAVLGRQTPFCNTTLCSGEGSVCRPDLCEPLAKIGSSQNRNTVCNPGTLPTGIVLATTATNRIPTDLNVALDIQGQRAHAAYTSKPFAQIQHTWECDDYAPFLAISGGYEFTNTKNSAVNMWNVGIQGGLAF